MALASTEDCRASTGPISPTAALRLSEEARASMLAADDSFRESISRASQALAQADMASPRRLRK